MHNITMSLKLLTLAFIQVTSEWMEDFVYRQKKKIEEQLT